MTRIISISISYSMARQVRYLGSLIREASFSKAIDARHNEGIISNTHFTRNDLLLHQSPIPLRQHWYAGKNWGNEFEKKATNSWWCNSQQRIAMLVVDVWLEGSNGTLVMGNRTMKWESNTWSKEFSSEHQSLNLTRPYLQKTQLRTAYTFGGLAKFCLLFISNN